MKCLVTFIFALICLLPTVGMAEDLWSMKELCVLAFDRDSVEIESDDDERGIRMYFSKWSPQIERAIQTALADTAIQYLVYPGRQATMMVALYSNDASLKFNMKRQQRMVQIIIGYARPELPAIEVLLDPDTLVPLPDDVRAMLEKGNAVKARKALLIDESTDPDRKELNQNRVSIAEAALRDSVAANCNPKPVDTKTPEAIESTVLLSWCHFSMGNYDTAEELLSRLESDLTETPESATANEKTLTRIQTYRRRILVSALLKHARENQAAQLIDLFARFSDEYLGAYFSINILELAAQDLNQLGLGAILARDSDKIMAKLNNEQLKRSAPVIAETYLNSEEYVKARDTASYFLEKNLSDWAKGRLFRVRAYVNLQDGNWHQAIADFVSSKELIIPSAADELALIEAYVRAEQNPITEMHLPEKNTSPVDQFRKRFVSRLMGERELKSGKAISAEVMATLPDHVLYFALKKAEKSKNWKLEKEISNALDMRHSSWAELADMETKVKQMRAQLDALRKDRQLP